MVKFLRRNWNLISKLGKKRKKKQKWKRPTGRDNKMREKRRGYSAVVSVGYKKDNTIINTLKGKTPVQIYNVKDLAKINKDNIGIIAKVGKKKREEILKIAKENKLPIYNSWKKKETTK